MRHGWDGGRARLPVLRRLRLRKAALWAVAPIRAIRARPVPNRLASLYLFLPFAIFAFGPSGYYGHKTAAAIVSLVFWRGHFKWRQGIQPDTGFISVLAYAAATSASGAQAWASGSSA
ncbi:MAG: hypothetical protein HY721_02850 [Planctomycetes bacterium]|nr:hypothetical protein [Planctomycetota bacterium]